MLHDFPLLSTIAMGLTLAFILGLAAAKLRLPPIVGYLLAGILIGPYTPGLKGDVQIGIELSELGIVLLMFGVGLHFSMKSLLEVQKIALPGALVQMAAATLMGCGVAHYVWGWSVESGVMFGLALSVASTVVLLRALEEDNTLQSTSGRIAVGWLIVEDMAMVLTLVLIPAIGSAHDTHTGAETWKQLFIAVGKVAAFIAVMVVGGKRLLPWLLSLVSQTRSRELFTLAVFATAMGVAFGAAKFFGVSFALGAFFAGMMIRESDLNHEVADRALPFQDAFAVLFFVSIGMLFNPAILLSEPLNVLLTVGIIVIGKSLAAFLIVLLFGYPLKTGLIVSSGLAQIGEFSFVLVSLGLSYGLLPVEGQQLILAGALISIMLNPLAFYLSRRVYQHVAEKQRSSSPLARQRHDLTHLGTDEKKTLKRPIILIGYGKVGKHILRNLRDMHDELVVIDSNRERVRDLREGGFHALAGDGASASTLIEAAIDKAAAVVVAIPNPFDARRIVEMARKLNPDARMVVRAYNDAEVEYFRAQNVDLALTAPREIGRGIADYLKENLK